jgi:general secretion pathway protein C
MLLAGLVAGALPAAHAGGGPAAAALRMNTQVTAGQGVQAPPRTALPMTLVGVMTDSADPTRSSCLIRCSMPPGRKSASTVQVRETVCDLAELVEIKAEGVVVRNLLTNRLELLPLQGSEPPALGRPEAAAEATPEPVVNESQGVVTVEVPKAAVEHYLVNVSDLLTSAQAAPRFRDAPGGQRVIDGFELRQIRSGSVIEKIGLKDGDVITEVNGEPLDGLPTVLRLFGQAQTMGQARLTVLRGSQRMTFVLNTK